MNYSLFIKTRLIKHTEVKALKQRMSKNVLRIEKRTAIIFIVLISTTSIISNFGYGIWWTGVDVGVNYGFPLPFYGYGGGPPLEPDQETPKYFFIPALIGDIIVWYLFSYLLIQIYDNLSKTRAAP